jgi:hypothetical protein
MCNLYVSAIPLYDSNLSSARDDTCIIKRHKPLGRRGDMGVMKLVQPEALGGLNGPHIAAIDKCANHAVCNRTQRVWHRHRRGYRAMLIDPFNHAPNNLSGEATPRGIMD